MVFLETGCTLYRMNDVSLAWGLPVPARGRRHGKGLPTLPGWLRCNRTLHASVLRLPPRLRRPASPCHAMPLTVPGDGTCRVIPCSSAELSRCGAFPCPSQAKHGGILLVRVPLVHHGRRTMGIGAGPSRKPANTVWPWGNQGRENENLNEERETTWERGTKIEGRYLLKSENYESMLSARHDVSTERLFPSSTEGKKRGGRRARTAAICKATIWC